jgi:hypothetical protein
VPAAPATRETGPTAAIVDGQGLMLQAIVTAADIQDHDGGAWRLGRSFGRLPFLLKRCAGGGCQGPAFRKAAGKVLLVVRKLCRCYA